MTEPKFETVGYGFKDTVRARRGELAETLVCDRLSTYGWSVFRGWAANPKIDILALKPSKVIRVQVKTVVAGVVDLRVGKRRLNWETIQRDVDFLIVVVPLNYTISSMFDANFYIIPTSQIHATRNLQLDQFKRFLNVWDVLDKFAALSDLIVVVDEHESKYAAYVLLAPDRVLMEASRHRKGCEVIVKGCAKVKREWYHTCGEDVFLYQFIHALIEASIHGLIHVADCMDPKGWTFPHDEVTRMARRLSWE